MAAILRVLACGVALVLAWVPAALAAAFLSVYDDLPLAPGLTEAPGAVVFDSPEGRIVEAQAIGAAGLSARSVRAFYKKTLPQLGWTADTVGFARDREMLKIDIDDETGPFVVHFMVTPR